ncbi:MAG TPA: PadR family transcriptional regulator [Solirubrobacterales bacterium]|nr:PadR family transcriptional regulator [Solirubrobacterales bacterium]
MTSTDPDSVGRPAPAIKLTPTSYLVLGMVRLGVSSGYRIKKAADQSTQNFWPTSLAMVYPELARLEAAGLLKRRSNPHGGRARSAYTITAKGEKALGSWLRSTKVEQVQIRDEAMLRLFLADALDHEGQLELVRRLRARNKKIADELKSEVVPQAEALESHGIRYVAAAARLSADLIEHAESRLGELESELSDSEPS